MWPAPSAAAAEAGCRLGGPVARSRHAHLYAADSAGGPVVLKLAAGRDDASARARFEREGRLGLGLRHPGLVETLRHGPGWIVLRDLRAAGDARARDLQDLCHARATAADGGRIALAPALGEVAGALAHLHARGLVHRDVKPRNILRAADGRMVLIDLGLLGLAAGDDLGTDELVGSPAWMAPEQLDGAPPRASADVWSLSLVLAGLLAGTPAFAGAADAVIRLRRNGGGPCPAFVRGLSAARGPLADLVRAGLSTEPAARPTAAAFQDALDASGRPGHLGRTDTSGATR